MGSDRKVQPADFKPETAPQLQPAFIVLEADRGRELAGTVLAADADLLSALDVEGVKYRTANELERSIAGL